MNAPADKPIAVIGFKRHRQNSLRGFVDLEVPRWRLTIYGCSASTSHGKKWILPPSRPLLDEAGVALRDERDRIRYTPVLSFDPKVRARFSAAAVEALLSEYPDAFD